MIKLNKQVFGNKYFGNKETNYEEVELSEQGNTIEMNFEDTRDITTLFFAVEYIRTNVENKKITLIMHYLPFSAMDRKIDNQIFSLELFANMINRLNFTEVLVLDPHNKEVTQQLFNMLTLINMTKLTDQAINDFKPDVLYFPDKGAMAKYPSMIDTKGLPIIYGNKVRDTANRGKITSYETITNGMDISGKRVLIIDDICRLGGTFVWAAEELTKLGVADIGLYISHCETGIFEGKILEDSSPISVVYTNDSEPGFIKLMSLEENKSKASKLVVISY